MSENIHVHVKSSPEARGKRLKSLRKMADLSRKTLAVKYQISASTLQAWEEGKAGGLTIKGAKRVIAALRAEGVYCTLDWLIHGIGKAPYLAERHFIGKEPEPIYQAIMSSEASIIAQELLAFRQLNTDVIDMVVQDDGMAPFYLIGDTVAGKRFHQKNIDKLIGKDCIVETQEGEILFRRLRKGNTDHRYMLQCINIETNVSEPTRYNIALISAAPVIWHRRLISYDE